MLQNTTNNMELNKLTFRFDDVCRNRPSLLDEQMAEFLAEKFPECQIVYGYSALTHSNCGERVYPKILNAVSDYRHFYKVDCADMPILSNVKNVQFASHGIVHVDHRLLSFEAQEMSILISCSLVKSKIFIPPFNKWDYNTEMICQENGIQLIRFEDGWRCLEYEKYDPSHTLWYIHAREWTLDELKNWF